MKAPNMKLTDIKLTDMKTQDIFQVAKYISLLSKLRFIIAHL